MREKHPIDERFKALYEAEATPPDEVRDSLAGRLDWDQAVRPTGTWSRWLLVAAGAALLITGTVHFLGQELDGRSGNGPTAQQEGGPAQGTGGDKASLTGPTPGSTPSIVDESTTEEFPSSGSTPLQPAQDGTHTAQDRPGKDTDGRTPLDRDGVVASKKATTSPDKSTMHAGDASPNAGATEPRNSNSNDRMAGGPDAGYRTKVPATSASAARDRDERHTATTRAAIDGTGKNAVPALTDMPLAWMELRLAGMDRTAEPTLQHARDPGPYVLLAGNWIVGFTVGAGRMSATWRTDDQQGLTDAERWRGSTLWGVDVGREWRSGWSVRSGLGLALDRSTFAWDDHEVERFTDVDTTWTTTYYNNTLDVVYTWNIDTLELERPGATRSVRSNNQYGAIRVPLTLAWYNDLRRWRFGAFSGITAFLPTQRQGSTLIRTADDARAEVVGLDDGRVDHRFGPRMNAHAGLSLGFHITEHLTVLAEPMLSTPIGAFGRNGAPWMRGQLLQFRLQHVFGASNL